MIMTSEILFYYSLYLIGPALADLLYLSFFSNQNTRIPTIISFIQLGINIILDFTLSRIYGLVGLALATTISQFSAVIIAFIMYKKTYGNLDFAYIGKNISKLLIGGAFLGIFAKFFFSLKPSNLWLLLTIALSAVIYLSLIYLLKVDGIEEIIQAFKIKIAKKRSAK